MSCKTKLYEVFNKCCSNINCKFVLTKARNIS